jgi:outer membrane protein assembly factor BamB
MQRENGRNRRALVLACCLLALAAVPVPADDWPQWMGPQRDGVWREKGILDRFPPGGPKVLWRTPVGGGYAGPAEEGGKVYVMDRQLPEGVRNPANPFARGSIPGKERVLCLDAKTGKPLWTHAYDCKYEISYPVGPRTTPSITDGKVYTVGAMGDLYCLDAASGKPVWHKNFMKEYDVSAPMWGFSASPLVDGNKVICLVGGKGSVVVAFDRKSGKELWKNLTASEPGYCPPIIIEAGGKRQLIVWHPEALSGLDPETGKVYWSEKYPAIKAGMTIPMPRKEGNLLFVSSFYGGSMMFKLDQNKPDATLLWKKKGRSERPRDTEALHVVMAAPVFKGDYIYGIDSYGELRCLKAEKGERVWTNLKALGTQEGQRDRWNTAFIVEQNGRYFLFTEKGELVIARMSPKGYDEIDRVKLLEPTSRAGRPVLWSHPAFAHRCMFARNDKEIICVSLAADQGK